MIVTTGTHRLLAAQSAYLATCYWGLYTNLVGQDIRELDLNELTEALWGGYNRQLVGPMQPVVDTNGESFLYVVSRPVFDNTSGATQVFRGWMLISPDGLFLIGYDDITNSDVLIPNAGKYHLEPAVVLIGI